MLQVPENLAIEQPSLALSPDEPPVCARLRMVLDEDDHLPLALPVQAPEAEPQQLPGQASPLLRRCAACCSMRVLSPLPWPL